MCQWRLIVLQTEFLIICTLINFKQQFQAFNIHLKVRFLFSPYQAVLLKDAMYIHKERVSDDLKPFHAHLEQRFTSWIKMIESEYKLQVS